MGDTYSAAEIRSTLRTFREYLRDLASSRFVEFSTKLRLFVNFAEKDDAVRVIARRLHTRAGDAQRWFQESAQKGVAQALPGGPADRLAHMYKVLLELKHQRIDIRNFLSTLFTSASIEEAHRRFQAAWLSELETLVRGLAERIEAKLDGREKADLEALVDAALEAPAESPAAAAAPAVRAKPAAKEKKGAAGAKPAKEPRLEDMVELLEKAVKGAKELATKTRKDVETDVKILKLEISKHVPDLSIVRTVAEPLARLGGAVAERAAAIARRVGGAAK